MLNDCYTWNLSVLLFAFYQTKQKRDCCGVVYFSGVNITLIDLCLDEEDEDGDEEEEDHHLVPGYCYKDQPKKLGWTMEI